MTPSGDSNVDDLKQEFDLRFRPLVGEQTYYRLVIVYRGLDHQGIVVQKEEYRGDFRRFIDSIDQGGPYQTCTWKNVTRRLAGEDGKYGTPERLEWADGFEYQFSPENALDLGADYDTLPRDMLGWNFLLLTVDAHFEFDFLRSSRHGRIRELRRIGDVVEPPSEPFDLALSGFIESPAMTSTKTRNTFIGLTKRNGEVCSVIDFEIDPSPFTLKMGDNTMLCSTSLAGTITSRLSDGRLEHGYDLEFVFIDGMQGCSSPVYEITRIEESDYERGSFWEA